MGGDAVAAEGIVQRVFADLAARGRELPVGVGLVGWLYGRTCLVAGTWQRPAAQFRREKGERARGDATKGGSEAGWAQVALILEDAMRELPDRDRDVLLLRYFQRQPLREVGDALGISEDAARVRADRALDRLRDVLARQGIASTSAEVGAVLAGHAVTAAPVGLTALVSSRALLSAEDGRAGVKATAARRWAKWKLAAIWFLAVAAVAVPFWQRQQVRRLQAENAALQAELERLRGGVRTEIERLLWAQKVTEQGVSAQRAELARLREQMGALHEASRQAPAPAELTNETAVAVAPVDDPEVSELEEGHSTESNLELAARVARMNSVRQWGLALVQYAEGNDGRMPTNLTAAAAYLSAAQMEPEESPYGISADQYEVVYHGRLGELADPASTILVREKEASLLPDGRWARTYLFADGHSEIHVSDTGDFTAWEQERMVDGEEP